MNNELETKSNDLKLNTYESIGMQIIESVANGEITSIDELSNKFSLPLTIAISLMSDPRIVSSIKHITEAKTNLFFHTKGVEKIIDLALQSNDDKTNLAALKLIAQISNNLKTGSVGSDVNVNISLESLIPKNEEKRINETVIDIS